MTSGSPLDRVSLWETAGAWLLAFLWVLPLLYAFWSAFHPPEYATRFDLLAPLSLENFRTAWSQAPGSVRAPRSPGCVRTTTVEAQAALRAPVAARAHAARPVTATASSSTRAARAEGSWVRARSSAWRSQTCALRAW